MFGGLGMTGLGLRVWGGIGLSLGHHNLHAEFCAKFFVL